MSHHSPLMNWINGLVGTAATGAAAILARASVNLSDLKEIGAIALAFISICIAGFTLFNAVMDARHKWRRDRLEKDAKDVDDLNG